MKKLLSTFLILAFALLFSCTVEKNENATIRFTLSRGNVRTITPDSTCLEITSYTFRFTSTEDPSFVFERILPRSSRFSYTIEGVKPGKYSVQIKGTNADGTVLAEKTEDYRFLPGLNSYSVTLDTLYGTGSFEVVFQWDASLFKDEGDALITPTTVVSLKGEDGTVLTVNQNELNMEAQRGKLTISKSNLPAGSYTLSLQLKNGSSYVTGTILALRITNGDTSTGTVNLNLGKNYSLDGFIVVDNTTIPLVATIIPSKTYSPGAPRTTEVVDFSLAFQSLPTGVSEEDISVKWYIEDYLVSSQSQCSVLLEPGTNLITAIYSAGKTGSLGSTTISFYYPEY